MDIHPYTDAHWRGVADLFASAFGSRCTLIAEPTRRGYLCDVWAQWCAWHDRSLAWVATDGGEVSGVISAHVVPEGEGIVTAPACAAGGEGAIPLLIEAAEAYLCDQGVVQASVKGLSKAYGVPFGGRLHTRVFLCHGRYSRCSASLLFRPRACCTERS